MSPSVGMGNFTHTGSLAIVARQPSLNHREFRIPPKICHELLRPCHVSGDRLRLRSWHLHRGCDQFLSIRNATSLAESRFRRPWSRRTALFEFLKLDLKVSIPCRRDVDIHSGRFCRTKLCGNTDGRRWRRCKGFFSRFFV